MRKLIEKRFVLAPDAGRVSALHCQIQLGKCQIFVSVADACHESSRFIWITIMKRRNFVAGCADRAIAASAC